ncbi:MAG: double-strand break repair protein AddB [Rhodospirillales bacterium]|nr:double-strand break repair protein AddB [Rhodospirillales bacterium]
MSPTVYTVPAGIPFLDALAAELLIRHGAEPLGLPRVMVLLPTRRAVRGLREAFLRARGGRPRLLPTMRPIGDIEEEELASASLGRPDDELSIPPEISALERQFLLARLIVTRPDGPNDLVRAVQLARELGVLLDQVHTERLTFDELEGLVPEEYAAHWQLTLDFLQIVTENWPKILAENGVLDPSDRRNRLIDSLASGWRHSSPPGPVIAAGSTGSIPATAELLRTISRLPQGAVVLPGLDTQMDDRSWEALDPSHPQFGMKQLLERMAVNRHEVELWPSISSSAENPARIGLMAAALRPAETTDEWPTLPVDTDRALDGLTLIEAPSPPEEAGAIALLMREALETEARTMALITPDRDLARRVSAELDRWGIEVDDSAGTPLDRTPPGSFLRLSAEMIADRAAPVPLLAALKHPLAAGGLVPREFRSRVRALERLVLRGPRPAPGFDGLLAALKVFGLSDDDGLATWVRGLAQMAAPLDSLMAKPSCDVNDLVRAHMAFSEALATTGDTPGCDRLWVGDAGEAGAEYVRDLLANSGPLPPMVPREYPALFETLMSARVVRPGYGRHPRVFIWGPLEARLQHADLIILGGLNEGTWPPEPPNDPWLSRPMREKFGLPSPERRIGLSAHDFAQAACARNVVLSRSEKVAGSPTVPARWLLRLKALAGDQAIRKIDRTNTWVGWHRQLDTPEKMLTASAPRPTPPVAARPRQISVTGVETWMRDPYSIYARRILRLKPLQELDADPGAADRGTFIHHALEAFIRENGAILPDDAFERLIEHGRLAFGDAMARPSVWAFWWPRFITVARWFIENEEVRRADTVPAAVEIEGRLRLDCPGGPFVLTAKADRLDRVTDGGLEIIDYKTGAAPSARILRAGYAPQLPLEAAIAAAGGFDGIPPSPVSGFSYWRLTGGDPAGEVKLYDGATAAELAAAAREGLQNLVTAFDRLETPYLSRPRPRPEFMGYGDYDHLARVKEWS